MKLRHPLVSRKWLGFLITGGTLSLGALIVKNGNYPALATALVALFSAFSAGNVVASALGEAPPRAPVPPPAKPAQDKPGGPEEEGS